LAASCFGCPVPSLPVLRPGHSVHFCTFRPERTPGSRVMYLGVGHSNREGNMDGLYLGIAIAGVNALVAMGLVIAFM
jgi:hypothetical protein